MQKLNGIPQRNQLPYCKPSQNVVIPIGTDFNHIPTTSETPCLLEPFDKHRITDRTSIPKPVPVVIINGETISTECNITTISGASKSGKSAYIAALIAGAISKDGNIADKLEYLEVAPNPKGKAVVHFDTEQAPHKHQQALNAVLDRAGFSTCPDNLLSYNLRRLDREEFLHVTTGICEVASNKYGGIHAIFIDGVADYISDVNDPVQSNDVVKYLEDLAIRFAAPVIVIVHTNPGSDKERGHLGSQLQRKSESVLTVKCEGDISVLEPKLLRMAGIRNVPLLQLRFDPQKGYHVGCGVKPNSQENTKGIERLAKLREIATQAFAPPSALKYSEALDAIMKYSKRKSRTAVGMLQKMQLHKMVVQADDKLYRLNLNEDF